MLELVDLEATEEGTIVETLRVVNPKDAVEPIRTRVVEWFDEYTFRSTEMAAEAMPAGTAGAL